MCISLPLKKICSFLLVDMIPPFLLAKSIMLLIYMILHIISSFLLSKVSLALRQYSSIHHSVPHVSVSFIFFLHFFFSFCSLCLIFTLYLCIFLSNSLQPSFLWSFGLGQKFSKKNIELISYLLEFWNIKELYIQVFDLKKQHLCRRISEIGWLGGISHLAVGRVYGWALCVNRQNPSKMII